MNLYMIYGYGEEGASHAPGSFRMFDNRDAAVVAAAHESVENETVYFVLEAVDRIEHLPARESIRMTRLRP